MALTTAKICALLLGGAAVGSVTTVTVQKVRPAVAKIKKPSKKVSQPAPLHKEKAVPFSSAPSNIMDCPLPSVPSFDGGLEYRVDPLWSAPFPVATETAGEVWLGSSTRPPAPAVPAPDVWVLMVAGFGFVGASLRRRKVLSNAS